MISTETYEILAILSELSEKMIWAFNIIYGIARN